MDFISAVRELKEGRCVGIYRLGWNPHGLHIKIDDFQWLRRSDGTIRLLHDGDALANDWALLPKFKVKRKVEGWVNVYPYCGSLHPISISNVYKTKEMAIGERARTHLGDPLYIVHEYEVEE